MKRLVALIMGVAFVSAAGVALAQAPSTTPPEKKAEKSAEGKRPATQNASGTVKAAAADNLVVSGKAKGGKDAEWTFSVDPKTKIRKAGKDVTAADLATGDAVLVRYHDQDGKHVADSVMVRAAKKSAETTKAGEAPKKDETKK